MADTLLGSLFWKLGIKSTVPQDVQKAEGQIGKLDDTSKKSEKSMASMAGAMTAAGAVAVGLGASIVMLTDSAKKTNAELGVTALQLGVSIEEMRGLALATTNVTFPLKEVTASFDLLTRAGMRDMEAIKEVATAYDTLGDATGNTASKVTSTMVTALKTFDISAEESTESIDGITYMLRNSIVEMENLDSVLGYITPDIVEMGLTLDDTAAMLGVMADKGMSGTVVTREFRTAMNAATSDTTDYDSELKDLGDTMDSLIQKQADLSDSTRDNSLSIRSNAINLANAKDRLSEMISEGKRGDESTVQYNRRLEEQRIRIESLSNQQIDLKEKQEELKISTVENTEAQADNVVETNLAEAAALDQSAALDGLYEKLGVTREEVEAYKEEMAKASGITQEYADVANTQYGAVDELKQIFEEFTISAGSALEPLDTVGVGLTTFGGIMMGVGPMMTVFAGIQTGTVVPSLTATAAAGWAAILPWLPLVIAIGAVIAVGYLLWDNWDKISTGLGVLWEGILDMIGAVWPMITEVVSDAIDFLWDLFINFTPLGIIVDHFDEILDFFDGVKYLFYDAGAGIMQFLVDGIASLLFAPFNLVQDALGFVGDLLPHSPAKTGPLSTMPDWGAYLVEPLVSVKPAMSAAATAAVSPVAAMSSSTATNNYDDSMHIDSINFENKQDIGEFWRSRDEQIRLNAIRRGVRT